MKNKVEVDDNTYILLENKWILISGSLYIRLWAYFHERSWAEEVRLVYKELVPDIDADTVRIPMHTWKIVRIFYNRDKQFAFTCDGGILPPPGAYKE